jgi:hypothetical protein
MPTPFSFGYHGKNRIFFFFFFLLPLFPVMPLQQGKKIKHPSPLHLSALMGAYFRNTLIKTPEGLSYLLILLCVVQGHGYLFQSVVGLPVLHVYIPIPYPIAFSFSDDRRMWTLTEGCGR